MGFTEVRKDIKTRKGLPAELVTQANINVLTGAWELSQFVLMYNKQGVKICRNTDVQELVTTPQMLHGAYMATAWHF